MAGKTKRTVLPAAVVVLVAATFATADLPAQTIPASPRSGGAEWGGGQSGSVIWDYGPTSGSNGGCWLNDGSGQNFAEQVRFPAGATIEGIVIFTCLGPASGTVEVRIRSALDHGDPGPILYVEEKIPEVWTSDPATGGYRIGFTLSVPFTASAGVTYWIGLAGGTARDIGQYSVLTPGNGTMAQFSGLTFRYHTGVGDQMFQLLDAPVPVVLEGFDIER